MYSVTVAGCGIDLADRPVLVAGVPGDALVIEPHGMRQRVGRQLVFLHLPGRGIEPSDQVAELPRPPDRAVVGLDRIARALTERRHLPFRERDFGRAGNELGRAPRVGREIRRKVLGNRVSPLRVRRQVDHGADQLFPAVAGVAGAAGDHVGLVALGADGFDRLLAGTLRQCGRSPLLLGLGGERDQRENGGSDQRNGRGSRHFQPSHSLFRSLPVNCSLREIDRRRYTVMPAKAGIQ